MNTNGSTHKAEAQICNDGQASLIVPKHPKIPILLHYQEGEKLYLHVTLLEVLTEFISPSSYLLCGEQLNENWGTLSVKNKAYRYATIPKRKPNEYNQPVLSDQLNWLAAMYEGAVKRKKDVKTYITIIEEIKEYEVLKSLDNPPKTVIKIIHNGLTNTYQK